MEANPTKNTFLQILLLVKGARITTDRFYKPTDTFQYLAFTSWHPVHTKKNVPFSLARRICTIVEEQDTTKKRLEKHQERAPSNLKKMLTRARFVLHEKEGFQTTKCSNSLCGTCTNLQDGVSEIKLNKAKITFKIKERMTCETKDVIYLITCNGCGKQYIGETQSLRERVTLDSEEINTHNIDTCMSANTFHGAPMLEE